MITQKKKILVAPLDWGLGHATRCIPVIQALLARGCEVQVASSGNALLVLKKEFPQLKFHQLPAYAVNYSTWIPLMFKIFLQAPKFLLTIIRERAATQQIARAEQIDFVISDNRYGCRADGVPSILIIHQVTLLLPLMSKIINRIHLAAIKNFYACWVPDDENEKSLAGQLSKNPKLNVTYIGRLSRMHLQPAAIEYAVLVIVSGPEPQRTLFENIMRDELRGIGRKCVMVRGLPGQGGGKNDAMVEEVDYLRSDDLNRAILASEIVVARSGYSTVMDLAVLGKKVIFVPTPGQPEQEYLARMFMKKGIAFSMPQHKFNWKTAAENAHRYHGFALGGENLALGKAIDKLLRCD